MRDQAWRSDLATTVLVTVELATAATLGALLLGVPLSWWLARRQGVGRDMIGALVSLPLVLPPTVLGFYMLLVLGPQGAGAVASRLWGLRTLAFTFPGLALAATVAALPYVVQSARAVFETMGLRPLEIAATLRASPWRAFWTVALPLATPGLLAGAVLAFAHTIGEFGLILMIGGDIPGQTRVLSVMLFDEVEADRWGNAHLLAFGMALFAFVVILGLAALQRFLGRAFRME